MHVPPSLCGASEMCAKMFAEVRTGLSAPVRCPVRVGYDIEVRDGGETAAAE